MLNKIFTKLKLFIKIAINKGIYSYIYLKTLFKDVKTKKIKTKKKYKTTFFEIVFRLIEKWKIVVISLLSIIFIYYGTGAFISSEIDNNLNNKIKVNKNSNYLNSTLIYTLKTQVDENQWTPALPIIFPASILDNLPNFQIGFKNSVNSFIKNMAKRTNNQYLIQANQLLNYPENIWLFSKAEDDVIAPGSAKQYRKALSNITKFNNEYIQLDLSAEDFIYYCQTLNSIMKSQTDKLQNYINEYHSKFIDFSVDDIFYQTQGEIYSTYYILSALSKDYQNLIVENNQYENIVSALSFLEKASKISPLIIKNSNPQSINSANHLLYLAYYLSQSQLYLQNIISGISITKADN